MGNVSHRHIDDPGLGEAMEVMEPGDQIVVQGNGGPMTIVVPSNQGYTSNDWEKEMEIFSQTYDPSTPRDESWFD